MSMLTNEAITCPFTSGILSLLSFQLYGRGEDFFIVIFSKTALHLFNYESIWFFVVTKAINYFFIKYS